MNARRLAALLVAVLVPALVACSSSSPNDGDKNAIPSGMPTDAAGLGRLLVSGVQHVTSAHIALDIDLAGQKLTGEGDEQLSGGRLQALDITESLPGGAGDLRVIVVGGKTYAKLPPSLNSSDKPYVVVSANSSNSVVRQLASSLDTALTSASLASVGTFATAAKSIEVKGTKTIDGIETVRYSIVVDVAKLPGTFPGRSQLQASGLKTLPMELYVDQQGRPIELTQQLSVQGQTVSTTAKITDYNKPVSIKAPPASQVGS